MQVARRAPFGSPTVGERGAITQRAILAAALEAFGGHGFHATTVELITDRADCSRPSFYQYFSSKEDVFWHLARNLAFEIRRNADSLGEVDSTAAGVEKVAEWLDALTDVYLEYGPIFSAFPAAVRGPSEELGDARGISERIGGAMMSSIAEGRRPDDLHALPSVTVSVVLRTISNWHAGLGGLTRRRFITGFAQTLHRLFHGPIDGVNMVPVSQDPPVAEPLIPVVEVGGQPAEPARRRARATRANLLAAGVSVLPERGYHDTRIADIVERAGVSHGTFYRYFPSKDALFVVLAERTATTLFELMTQFPGVADESALRVWFEEYFASYRANGGVISVWQEIDVATSGLDEYSLAVAVAVFQRLELIARTRTFGDHAVDALVLLAIMDQVPFAVAQQLADADTAIGAAMFIIRDGIFGLDVG